VPRSRTARDGIRPATDKATASEIAEKLRPTLFWARPRAVEEIYLWVAFLKRQQPAGDSPQSGKVRDGYEILSRSCFVPIGIFQRLAWISRLFIGLLRQLSTCRDNGVNQAS